MDFFRDKGGETFCEDVSLTHLATQFGTPLYVYSEATLMRHADVMLDAFAHRPTQLSFAVKANSNLLVLKRLFSKGFGADVVSIGELERALLAGVDPDKIVFSGVAKQHKEIDRGIACGLYSFNVESAFELEMIGNRARELGQQVPICFRVNPNVDAKTNPKITTGLYETKFGIALSELDPMLEKLRNFKELTLRGLACHIGSQMLDLQPLQQALSSMVSLTTSLLERGYALDTLNMGGGLGVSYDGESPPLVREYAKLLTSGVPNPRIRLVIEPGRVIAGNMGILVTRVVGIKRTPAKSFVLVDAAMNDNLRPAMYGAVHRVEPVKKHGAHKTSETETVDVVGPICESSDFLAKGVTLPRLAQGDLVFLRTCGAYTATMASNYNSRPRAAEVIVDGSKVTLARKRETLDQLWAPELENL